MMTDEDKLYSEAESGWINLPEFLDEWYDALKPEADRAGLVFVKTSRGSVMFRCHKCGDTVKRFDAGHGDIIAKCSVKTGAAILVWRCFRCSASGVVRFNTLTEIGFGQEGAGATTMLMQKHSRSPGNICMSGEPEAGKLTYVPGICDRSRQYVEGRLDRELPDPDVCKAIGLVLDAGQFIEENLQWLLKHGVNCKAVDSALLLLVRKNGFVARLPDTSIFGRFVEAGSAGSVYSRLSHADMFRRSTVNVALVEGVMDYIAVSTSRNDEFAGYHMVVRCKKSYDTFIRRIIRAYPHVHIDVLANLDDVKRVVSMLDRFSGFVDIYTNAGDATDFGVPDARLRKIRYTSKLKGSCL